MHTQHVHIRHACSGNRAYAYHNRHSDHHKAYIHSTAEISLHNAFLHCPCSVLNCNLQIINFVAAFVVLLVQVFAKPYKDTRNNIIETAILVNFVLVAASYLQSPETTAASVMVVILTLLPYVYAVVYIAIATGRKM